MTPSRDLQPFDVETIVRGGLPLGVRLGAVRLVRDLAHYSHEPVLHAQVRLTRTGDPARAGRVIVQVNLDVNGRPVVVRAVGHSAQEAFAQVRDRARRRLDRLARHWEARRGTVPAEAPRSWRHAQAA